MDSTQRLDELDTRIRKLEQDNSSTLSTMQHFTTSMDNFVKRLDKREDDEVKRFNKFVATISSLTKLVYIGMGALAIIQFLVSNNLIKLSSQ